LKEFLSLGHFSFNCGYIEIWKAAIFVNLNFLVTYVAVYTQFPGWRSVRACGWSQYDVTYR